MAPSPTPPALHTYNVLIAMPLPPAALVTVFDGLHQAADRRPPPPALINELIALGPVPAFRRLRTIPRFGRRRVEHLRAALSAPTVPVTLATLLQQVTRRAPSVFEPAAVEEKPQHPLGEDATFPPLVAQALGRETYTVYGEAVELPPFRFSKHILDFRRAIRHPPPRRAVIVGAGYVGSEMAVAWGRAGSTVTLIERHHEVLYSYPHDQITAVRALMREARVRLVFHGDAMGWRAHRDHVVVAVRCYGGVALINADKVLVSVGVHVPDARR